MPGKMLGLTLTGGLVAVAAVVGGAIWYTSSQASEVNLTTANFVPEDAGVYFALNTDLTSSQWVSTFNLAERLGTEDPEEELKDSADDADIDWEDDVAPFLGGNAAIFVRGIDIENFGAQGAVILKCTDAEAALEVIEDQAGLGDEDEYEGIEYFEAADGGYAAVIGDHLVIAFDEESLEAVIDVHLGNEKSLASNADFQRLRDELTRNFLGFVYVNAEDLLGNVFLDDPVIRAAIEDSGSGDLILKPAAWVLGATSDGFEFQAASIGSAGAVSPMLAPRESKLIKHVPADAAIFFSTANIAATWEAVLKDARPEIDEAIREEGEYDSLDDALEAAGEELGIESVEQLIELLTGETAVAAWFPSGDEDDAEWVLLAEVDEGAAKDLLEDIVASQGSGSTSSESVNGHEVTVFESDDGEDGAYAFLDGNLVFGTRDAVARVLTNEEPPLSDLRKYRDTVEQMPSSLGTFGYFDLSKLLRLAEGGVPAELDEAEEALSGLIINGVDERGIVRYSGILTVEE
jgi:hypothetical protein